jgi:hypothetical protein
MGLAGALEGRTRITTTAGAAAAVVDLFLCFVCVLVVVAR